MIFAPAKTPAAIVDKLNAAIRHALTVPAVADVVQKAGYMPDGRNAAQTAEFFRQQVAETGEAVRAAGPELKSRPNPRCNHADRECPWRLSQLRNSRRPRPRDGADAGRPQSARQRAGPTPEQMAAQGYRVLIHDRRNCGASDVSFDGSKSEYEVWADDLHVLLKQLGMLPAIIGGTSSGARLSLLFALRYPQDVRALVLWRITGGEFAIKRLTEKYYDQYIRLAEAGRHGGGLRRGALRRAHPRTAGQPRAADGARSQGLHRHAAPMARAVRRQRATCR